MYTSYAAYCEEMNREGLEPVSYRAFINGEE